MSSPSAESSEPNMTPILDMVFQLITFFMLVINFKGATMDLTLKLPVLGSAKPIDWKGGKEPLVLNIDTEGNVKAYGQTIDVEQFIAKESRLAIGLLKASGTEVKDELPIPVIIRADEKVTFHQLNSVIRTCQNYKFRQFQLSAMTSEKK